MTNSETIPNKSKQQGVRLVLSAFLAVFGFAFLQYYVGYLLWMFILIVLTYKTGIEIDHANRRIRHYWSVLNRKKGQWESLNAYNSISIKKVKKGVRRYSAGLQSTETYDFFYQIILMDVNKRSRQFLLFSGKDKTEIKYLANNWSIQMQMPIIDYAASKTRRR